MNNVELLSGGQVRRRDFLRNSICMTLPLMAGTAIAGMRTGGALGAVQQVYVPPTRTRGSTIVDVSTFGARGDGVHDDTLAIQAAINSLPSTGGTVVVPAGTYLIDAVRSINLRSLMHLQMSMDAKLVVKATSADGYSALYANGIHDVEVSGGQIVGDRDQHLGTTGEGGHCIRVRGSVRVTVRDMMVSKGWGDGISVGPKTVWGKNYIYSQDVVVANVICTGNRRNGLSIGNVIGMKVYDSQFNDTHGTAPQCGIDVEPDKDRDGSGHCDNVWIENCVMRGNAKYGVNVWKRTTNLTITKCMIDRNLVCGLVTRGLVGANFIGNTICNTVTTGMFIQLETADVGISDNTFYNNYTKQGYKPRSPFDMTGVGTGIRKDLIVGDGTTNIRVGLNHYK